MSTIALPKPSWTTNEVPTSTDLTNDFTTIVNDYNGNILDVNIAANAAIQASKGEKGGFAVLAGSSNQTLATPTLHSLPWKNALAGNSQTIASAASIAVNGTTLLKLITGTTTISTITGGVEGQIIVIVATGGALTLTHTGTDVAGNLHLRGNASATIGAAAPAYECRTLLCTKLGGLWTNLQWIEVGS